MIFAGIVSEDRKNDFYFNNRLEDAIKISLWAHQLFQENLNLNDIHGEMFQHKGNKTIALKYYKLLKIKLEQMKDLLPEDIGHKLKSVIRNRINHLGDQQ